MSSFWSLFSSVVGSRNISLSWLSSLLAFVWSSYRSSLLSASGASVWSPLLWAHVVSGNSVSVPTTAWYWYWRMIFRYWWFHWFYWWFRCWFRWWWLCWCFCGRVCSGFYSSGRLCWIIWSHRRSWKHSRRSIRRRYYCAGRTNRIELKSYFVRSLIIHK